MKFIFVLLFSLLTMVGFGQSVTAPEPKSFTMNTAGQDASGFYLSGFNSTATLLCAIGLPQSPSGTTFSLSTITGLTPATGYSMSGNKTRLAFTGTMANINNALATLKINTTGTAGNVQISVSATVNPTGYYYNPSNGHFYRPISTTATYDNAKTLSAAQTFKGQTGYLVTLTSADEENFVILNVPQNNIWIALSDRLVEAQWRIDAGPEAGTLIKTSNGQTAGNIQGQYNNWCGGEPNNAGDEDYAVTKWGGGSCWNDLPAFYSNPYIIEFGTWTNPDDQTFTDFYSNSVIHSNGNTLRAQFTFNFGSNVDETKFKSKVITSTDDITYNTNNTLVALNGIGRVDLTTQIDTAQINGDGYKASTSAGQVEWAIINPYNSSLGGHQLLIDQREFDGTGISPNDVKSIQLFDIYDGPVTVNNISGWWKIYVMPGNLTDKITSSAYQAQLRLQDGWYGTRAEFTFQQNTMFKYHKISMDVQQSDLLNLLGSAVTVGDVYLAFKEFADKGILGDESKYFSSGIQFHNADVNDDGIFDERDCYALLTHLQGTTSLWPNPPALGDIMKIVTSTSYDNITKQNWNTYTGITRYRYPFTFTNGVLNSYSLDITWKGDVNLSHSSQPNGFVASANSAVSEIKSMAVSSNSVGEVEADIMLEKVGDSVVATINLNPNGNQIGATQFDVFFDNSVLDFTSVQFSNSNSTNFGKNNGTFISIGSLSTSGGTITNIGYKVTFKPKTTVTNLLGLISVKSVETLNTSLNKIIVKVI